MTATSDRGEGNRSLTGMSVPKVKASAGFVKTHFSCVWRLYILMLWRRSMQQELPCEISENSPGEEKLWRLRMDLQNQNEQSFVSCLQNCLFLLAVVLNSSKEENLRVRASKAAMLKSTKNCCVSFLPVSLYGFRRFLKGRLRLAPERENKQQGRRNCLITRSIDSTFYWITKPELSLWMPWAYFLGTT